MKHSTHAYREASPPPRRRYVNARDVVAVAAFALFVAGCSWFRPSPAGDPPPAQAVVLYVAKAVQVANAQCVAAGERMLERSKSEDTQAATETLRRAKELNEDCRKATVSARAALEGVEHLVEVGGAIDEKKVGCAIKRGLDAAADICVAMKSAKVGQCPSIVDSAITFGSPLLSAVGACPVAKEGAK